jgi:ribulose-5-phosphate 4-epimerase/fuculose-1-phosphate aldolase
MNFEGQVIGSGKPSSEWHFHSDLLRHRPELNAIVHTHSPNATALACLREDLPAFHYMIAIAGGDSIRCAPYALFGTQTLSDYAVTAMQDRKACLLANHGLIAAGRDLDEAMAVAIEIESLCQQYLLARQHGQPVLLSTEEMQAHHRAMREQFRQSMRDYWKKADTDGDGALSKAEAEAAKMQRLVRDFDKLDKNKDGKLTADEMAAAPHHKMTPQP